MMSEKWTDLFCIREEDKDLLWQCQDEELLERLDLMMARWEQEIDTERERQERLKYISDKLENQLTLYAWTVVNNLVCVYENEAYPEVNRSGAKGWRKLFHHRHFAYQLYRLADISEGKEPDEIRERLYKILDNEENQRILYLEMARYFELYYGTFSDNELAIRMICSHYPDGIQFSEEEQGQIVAGLFQHISTAGSERDRGFAFNGIKMIEQWISCLPVSVVLLLLKQYRRYHIDNEVNRHQIHAIITNSSMEPQERQTYKFLYLDSLMYMKSIEPLLARKWAEEGSDRFTSSILASCEEPRMVLAEKNEKEYAWWVYEQGNASRTLYVEQEVYLIISLDCVGNSWQIKGEVHNKNGGVRCGYLGYDQSDWLLNQYERYQTAELLERLLGMGNDKGDMRKFLFSHVYLNGYRGLCRQQLSFDHSCLYDPEAKVIQMEEGSSQSFSGFYGDQIHSLSCIVGKNGMGKTGILDFLRDSFFRLLEELDAPWVNYMDHVFQIHDYHSPGLNKDMEFLVVFRLGEKRYFFTNIAGLKYDADQIKPYPKYMQLSSQEHSKIIYFSNKIDGNMVMRQRGSQGGSNEEGRRYETSEGVGNVDYSSAASYFNRLNSTGDPSYVNQELCYQLAFLDAHPEKKLQKLLDWDIKKENLVWIADEAEAPKPFSQWMGGTLGNWLTGKTEEEISQILRNPGARIGHFSSGQFSKLDFLSKLYWCLSGYERYHETFEAAVGKNSFKVTDSLQPGETAIIFIDEGELYYHPEWQRKYVYTLLDMIQRYGRDVEVQIVITTNSPFILSDMLNWDVTYLPSIEHEKAGAAFGQNIHTLLTSNFYMDATIGEVSRRCIGGLIWLLRDRGGRQAGAVVTGWINYFLRRQWGEGQARAFLAAFISGIGEEIYREELLDMLDACWEPDDQAAKLDDMRRQQERLAQQIRELELKLGGKSV